MKVEADSYLRSGSNEVRVLEYKAGGLSFGINILKVNKVVSKIDIQTSPPESHPAVRGIFEDRGRIIPIIDLARFLGLEKNADYSKNKVVITEFFELSNGFLVERVDWIHHFKWEDVIDADGVLGKIDHRYILGMVKPSEDHIVMLLDYETIILDLCPNLTRVERNKVDTDAFDFSGMKVLVAEDSSSVRSMLEAELNGLGFEVVAVSDGVEALNMMRLDADYDLVVSDVEMPRMDGLALTVAIRDGKAGCNPDLPVVVYSSIGDIGMKTRAEYLKANAHVTKLNIEELLVKVRELMSGYRKKDTLAEEVTAEVETA